MMFFLDGEPCSTQWRELSISRALLANLGFGEYRRKNWYLRITPYLNLGLQKLSLNLGLWDFILSQCWITAPFEIGIMGLHST